jgi:ankyrin repeat protein
LNLFIEIYLNNLFSFVDNYGETALFLASALGNAKIVKLLLRNNANPNICNSQNVTPLTVSSYNGHTDTVKALLDKGGVDINYQDNLCKTALSFAAHEGQPLIVELLLKNGADVNIADKVRNFFFFYNLKIFLIKKKKKRRIN